MFCTTGLGTPERIAFGETVLAFADCRLCVCAAFATPERFAFGAFTALGMLLLCAFVAAAARAGGMLAGFCAADTLCEGALLDLCLLFCTISIGFEPPEKTPKRGVVSCGERSLVGEACFGGLVLFELLLCA